jgi:hypothetical protein
MLDHIHLQAKKNLPLLAGGVEDSAFQYACTFPSLIPEYIFIERFFDARYLCLLIFTNEVDHLQLWPANRAWSARES